NRLRGGGYSRNLQRRELEGRRRDIANGRDGAARACGEGCRNRNDVADREGKRTDRGERESDAPASEPEQTESVGRNGCVIRTSWVDGPCPLSRAAPL